MWHEIAAWQETLTHRPDLSAKTIALYTQDARRFATWLQNEHAGLKATEVTSIDAKAYRDHHFGQTLCSHDHQSCAHQPHALL